MRAGETWPSCVVALRLRLCRRLKERRARRFVIPEKALGFSLFDRVTLSVQRLVVWQGQDFVAGFLPRDGVAADEKVEPSALIP